MIERIIKYDTRDEKIIERLVTTNDLNLNHVVLLNGDKLPEHFSNANVHLIVIRGELTIKLDDQNEASYVKGDIVNVKEDVKMSISNKTESVLEFFIVKAPGPTY